MKKYLLGLVAVVFAVGLSAFTAPERDTRTSISDPSYYWFDGELYSGFRTKDAEKMVSGCTDSTIPICREGYDVDDLFDPEHPESGLNQDAEVRETITKSN